jgi:hypothetical protein
VCERCEKKGLLTGLLGRAGVVATRLPPGAGDARLPASPTKPQRRPKLWELEEKLHCPVIGTCLSLDEIARIARRMGFSGHIGDPYRLHVEAVSLSCSKNEAACAMHKLLERKFNLYVAHFNRLKSDAEVLARWRACLERGEVAGPMWATLTHKLVGAETRRQVYADVHMLSHQIGAGQAADLRRLEWLQGEHASLRAEHARIKAASQRQKEAEQSSATRAAQFERERDDAREQAEQLVRRVGFLESGQAMVALGRRLLLAEAQAARTLELEARFKELARKVGILRAEKVRLTRERDEAASERDALERLWLEETAEAKACGGDCASCEQRLQGRCVLCVGGRTPLLPQYRALAERLGVRLIHHDGGREEALARLPELLNASDAVICPTDCVGHLAYYQLKKHCKQNGKPCVLAKSSGVAGFAAALASLAEGRADIRSQT